MTRLELSEAVAARRYPPTWPKRLYPKDELIAIDAVEVVRLLVNRMYVNDQEFGNAAGWNGALDKVNNLLISMTTPPQVTR